MKVDLTDAIYKIIPNSPKSYLVYRKYNWVPDGTDPWVYQTTFTNLREAERYVKEKIDFCREYEEQQKRDKEFQKVNPPKYYG